MLFLYMNQIEILSGINLLPLQHTAVISSPSEPPHSTETDNWFPKKQLIGPSRNGSLISKCLRSGHMVFVAGIGGWYEADRAEPGDAKVQLRSALNSMKESLELAGSNMPNVLQLFITIADPNKNLAPINEVLAEFFPKDPPALTFSSSKITQMGRNGILLQAGCIAYAD